MTRPRTTINEYISSCTPDAQSMVERVRRTVRSAVPAAGEKITYGLPTEIIARLAALRVAPAGPCAGGRP
jgi:uncharacterized protein YdhG (YjbR/CyaY superfamily)